MTDEIPTENVDPEFAQTILQIDAASPVTHFSCFDDLMKWLNEEDSDEDVSLDVDLL